MPLSQRELVLYDRAKKLADSVDMRQLRKVAAFVDRVDPLREVPAPTVPESERVPFIYLDGGRTLTIPREIPRVVTARYSNNVSARGFDSALAVAARELVGNDVDHLDDDDRTLLLGKLEEILSVEVNNWPRLS